MKLIWTLCNATKHNGATCDCTNYLNVIHNNDIIFVYYAHGLPYIVDILPMLPMIMLPTTLWCVMTHEVFKMQKHMSNLWPDFFVTIESCIVPFIVNAHPTHYNLGVSCAPY